jgi:endoglucanase
VNETLKNEIIALSNLPGVSSWEDLVRDYIIAVCTQAGCAVQVDALGNVIAEKKGARPAARKLLLAAHMDEVGLMISGYEEDGCLRMEPVGRVDRRCLIGKRMLVGEAQRLGVVGNKAVHLTTPEERKKTPKLQELYLDIGARTKEEAEKLAPLGSVCAFQRGAGAFGSGLVKGPALDSRIPCAILLELVRGQLPVDCTFAFTIQQQVGSRGAFGMGFAVKPDCCLVLSGANAKDYPGNNGGTPKLGGGPVLSLMDDSAIYDRGLFQRLSALAGEKHLAYQCQSGGAGGQGGVVQRSRAGVPVAAVKIPVRYENTPAGLASLQDCEDTLALVTAFLEQEAAR